MNHKKGHIVTTMPPKALSTAKKADGSSKMPQLSQEFGNSFISSLLYGGDNMISTHWERRRQGLETPFHLNLRQLSSWIWTLICQPCTALIGTSGAPLGQARQRLPSCWASSGVGSKIPGDRNLPKGQGWSLKCHERVLVHIGAQVRPGSVWRLLWNATAEPVKDPRVDQIPKAPSWRVCRKIRFLWILRGHGRVCDGSWSEAGWLRSETGKE